MITVSVLRLRHNAAHARLIKISIETVGLIQTIARFPMVRLLAGSAGLALAGVAIERMRPTGGFVLSADAAWLSMFPAFFVSA